MLCEDYQRLFQTIYSITDGKLINSKHLDSFFLIINNKRT